MAHTELDLRKRRAIEDMLNAKVPVSKIAAEIGRHRSTVYREIKRNYFTDEELPYLNGYYGMYAQRYASDLRARRRKLIRDISTWLQHNVLEVARYLEVVLLLETNGLYNRAIVLGNCSRDGV